MRIAIHTNAILWLALAAMWSSSYVVIKIGLQAIDPAVLVMGRMLVGGLAIYVVLKCAGMSLSRAPADWISYIVTGLLGSALPFLLISWAEQSVDSALASILMGTVPIITLLLAVWVVPDESPTPPIVASVLGGLAGISLLVGPSALSGLGSQATGQVAIVGATICYAASTVYIRRFTKRPPLEMAAGSLIAGTLFVIAVIALTGTNLSRTESTATSLGAVVYLGLFSTACANLIYFHLVPRIGATRTAQVNFAVPVGGAILGILVLGETLTLQRTTALALILGSVWLGTSSKRRRADLTHR